MAAFAARLTPARTNVAHAAQAAALQTPQRPLCSGGRAADAAHAATVRARQQAAAVAASRAAFFSAARSGRCGSSEGLRRRRVVEPFGAAGVRDVRCAAVAAEAVAQSNVDLKEVIEALILRDNLTQQQTQNAMEALLADGANPAQTAAFLVLLRAKGETAEEVAGLAKALQSKCVRVHIPENIDDGSSRGSGVLDIVGTGGDGANTVNISTGACVLAAACGARVAKHGNRSVSSACGSADVLEALGVAIDLGPEGVAKCVEEVGVGFMMAPRYHPAMAAVSPVRKALRVRTAFNLLGPMLNPALAPFSLVGVFHQSMVELMAASLQRLGSKRALVVHCKGLDEISPMAAADMLEVTPTSINSFHFDPLDVGIQRCMLEDLRGGDASVNAQMLKDIFAGERGPKADALVLNAGAGMYTCGLAGSVAEGVSMAQEVQRSGKAADVLQKWVELSQALKSKEAQ